MPWWTGGTLLDHLESVEIAADRDLSHRRFPVQWVIRPMSEAHHDYRGYAGQVAGGEWRAGEEVVVVPSGLRTRVAAVETYSGPLEVAVPGMSVVIRVADDLDVSRGDMLSDPIDTPIAARQLQARVCWMSEHPARPGAQLALKHTTRWVRAILDAIESKLDVETLDDISADALALNDIGVVRLRLSGPVAADPYAENRATGAFILVDEATNNTVAAGMVIAATP
jgi:sulfate adenylyltransferase subunit 1 (EFTu-like GTPase family)